MATRRTHGVPPAGTTLPTNATSVPVNPPTPPSAEVSQGHALYPLLSPMEVLHTIIALSREVTADMGESNLLQVFYGTLRNLLPNRLIAVRTIDPRTLRATEIQSDDGLVDDAWEMPPSVQRGALDHANVRENLPEDLMAQDGSQRTIAVVDHHPLIFRDAVAGFSVPLLAGGELTGEVHVNYRGPAGQKRPSLRSLPLRQDKGLVIPLANHVAVVAHTRRLLRETAYLQNYLEQIIDQANVLIVACDPAGKVTIWNRAMTRLTGFSRAQTVGRDLLPWLNQLGAPDIAAVIKQVTASADSATREVRLPSVGGAILRAAFNVVTVRAQGGQAAATLAIGQDVTALRSLQSQVIHAEKLATVGQIAAGVAHEINNPLTSIQVCAEALVRKGQLATAGKVPNLFEAPDLDRLRKIQEGSERIRRFARDLVSYARPSGTEVEEITLNEVIEHGLSFCEHVLEEFGVTVERDYAKGLPVIRAVRDQLLQVVINLVTNAAHAVVHGEGTIRVRTWTGGEALVSVAVTDNGSGIKDEDRQHVFEPFFSTKPAGQGTGLGLSVVRNIVYSHGGQISFQSRRGGGTTFVVTLPVTHMAPPVPQGDKST